MIDFDEIQKDLNSKVIAVAGSYGIIKILDIDNDSVWYQYDTDYPQMEEIICIIHESTDEHVLGFYIDKMFIQLEECIKC